MEVRPELVQHSCKRRVTCDDGEVDQVTMVGKADWARPRSKDLLVPREAPALVLCGLVCAQQRCRYKMVPSLPSQGMQNRGSWGTVESPPVQAAFNVSAACCCSADRNGKNE